MRRFFTVACAMLALHTAGLAQTNPTAQSLPYTEDFSTLTHASTTYPAGWQGWTVATAPGSTFNTSTPTADRNLTASSTAGVNSGNVHNYDGKIGFLNTGLLDLGLVLAINTTNKKNVKVAYDVMTIRNPHDGGSNTRVNEVTLQYRVGTTGSFTNLTGIEYQNNTTTQTTTITTPQNTESKSIKLPAACDSEAVVQIRWVSRQVSGGGSRPSFAIDNVSIDTANTEDISIAATANANEGVTPVSGTFIFTFAPPTAATTTFNYAVTGTANFGTDYTLTLTGATPATISAATGTITVPSATTTFTATVTPINDATLEGLETVIMKITNPSGDYVIGDSVATVNIIDDEATPIHDIQGSGATAIAGNYTVEGIVTGVYPTLSPAGFYMQEEDADADSDPNTSEGIFIVSNATVAAGDKVRAAGTAIESAASPSFQQAVLNNTTVSVISSGNAMPTAVDITLPVATLADYEKVECMLVHFTDTLTVTDNYNLGRYGEINLSQGGMTYQPTQNIDVNDITASGNTASGNTNTAAIAAYAMQNALRTILMDDGRGTIPTLPFVNNDNTLRLGSTISGLTGILGYAFSVYRVQPVITDTPEFHYAPRPMTPPAVGTAANIKIASLNVLNYFNGDGVGGGFPTSRGANSPAEFGRQRAKIINAISAIDADVVGLIEIENDGIGTNSAIQDLVNGLNAKMGANTYSIVNDGATTQINSGDEIRCGIIYKASKVDTVGVAMLSPNTVFNRPPLAQTFKVKTSGLHFNYIINHFKSKGCSGSTGADVDQMDGQSCYNETRKKQAGELMNFIGNTVIPTSGSSMILSMGDYNSYFQEDPLDSLRSGGFTVLSKDSSFSYLFSGLIGSLDNAIVNDSMKAHVTGIAKWNINSAEPIFLDYQDNVNDGGSDVVNPWGNTYSDAPFRSSDHDPVIVGLDMTVPNSVKTIAGNSSFVLYPNPVDGTLYIQSTVAVASWQINNSLGQTVQQNLPEAQHNLQINVSNLAPGVYYLHLYNADGSQGIKPFVRK
ncbi:MAG: ExeM/NucH family extracellular endonuclease [Sphingobacteriales bacterium]|nr:MAG: ExeM/NucH family extracellular endonuclease [Sphingobacteriales bacterium]